MEKTKKIKIFLIITLAVVFAVIVGFININRIQHYSINQKAQNAPEEVTPKFYSVNMLLNELNKIEDVSVSGSKVKITLPEGLSLSAYNASTNDDITADESGKIEVPDTGIRLEFAGIKEGEKYDITIEQAEVGEEYVSRFKSAIIEINAENGELKSFVKKIVKSVNGEDVEQEGSEAQTAIFMYEDDENTIKIKGNEEVEIKYYTSKLNNELTDVQLAEIEWNNYNKETGIVLEKNCIVYSKSKFKTGEYSSISRINVTNIDKIAPNIDVTNITANDGEATVNFEITDEESEDYGASGIVGYALTYEDVAPENFIECENSNNVVAQIGEISSNGTYYLWAKDAVGNIGKKEFEVNCIVDTVVAIILDSPFEELNGKEYYTLTSLLAELKEKEEGATLADDARVVIQMVHNDKKETVEFDDTNVDILLDLNGYEISSKSEEKATITVKSENVQIVDNKYEISNYITDSEKLADLQSKYSANGTEYGKIKNSKYIGIEVLTSAVFTLGEDDSTVSIVNPVIEGAIKGIYNKGEFNYYDGIILGQTTIDGTVNLKPLLYDTTVSVTGTEGIP